MLESFIINHMYFFQTTMEVLIHHDIEQKGGINVMKWS